MRRCGRTCLASWGVWDLAGSVGGPHCDVNTVSVTRSSIALVSFSRPANIAIVVSSGTEFSSASNGIAQTAERAASEPR